MTSLVVGFDQHPASKAALAFGATLANKLAAQLHVVHVVDDEDAPIDPDSDDREIDAARLTAAGRAAAAAHLQSFEGEWQYRSLHGVPAEVLARVAADTDAAMIVLGVPRRGPRALVERLLGESVSAATVHLAGRPVLMVPEEPLGTLD